MNNLKKLTFFITLLLLFCFISYAQSENLMEHLLNFHLYSSLNSKDKEKVQALVLKNNNLSPEDLQNYLLQLDSLNVDEINVFFDTYQMMLDSLNFPDTLKISLDVN